MCNSVFYFSQSYLCWEGDSLNEMFWAYDVFWTVVNVQFFKLVPVHQRPPWNVYSSTSLIRCEHYGLARIPKHSSYLNYYTKKENNRIKNVKYWHPFKTQQHLLPSSCVHSSLWKYNKFTFYQYTILPFDIIFKIVILLIIKIFQRKKIFKEKYYLAFSFLTRVIINSWTLPSKKPTT